MTTGDTTADTEQDSNWTRATGTKPGAREVYSPPPCSTAASVRPDARSSESRATQPVDAKHWCQCRGSSDPSRDANPPVLPRLESEGGLRWQ
jgi:hypothetical protein